MFMTIGFCPNFKPSIQLDKKKIEKYFCKKNYYFSFSILANKGKKCSASKKPLFENVKICCMTGKANFRGTPFFCLADFLGLAIYTFHNDIKSAKKAQFSEVPLPKFFFILWGHYS